MNKDSFRNNSIKAILVGVTDYSAFPDTTDLPAGENDVRLMASALVAGLCVNPFHIWVKRGKTLHVTRTDFLEGVRKLLSDTTEEDVAVFYYSGHGVLLPEGHALLFSDGPLLTQSVVDLLEKLHVKRRILFLDCCMSGEHEIAERNRLEGSRWIEDLLKGGTIVFSSSRSYEKSGYARKIPASLFTVFLWNAMTNRFYLKEGCLSMDQIRDLVYREAAAWNKAHPERSQHPVFRSNMGGTIYFPVTDYHPYPQQKYFREREDYCIVSVSPLHSRIAKRYAVKVILKHAVTEKELVSYNHEIIRAVQPLEIFSSGKQEEKWKGKPLNLVFTYFGFGEEDIASGNHAYYTTWADPSQDRNKWYQGNGHGKILEDILVTTNPYYPLCRKLTEKNSADDETVLQLTKEAMRRMIDLGENVLTLCQEYRNGFASGAETRQQIRSLLQWIDRLYLELSDLPVPSAALARWSLLCANIAGDVQDFSVFLSGRLECFENGKHPGSCPTRSDPFEEEKQRSAFSANRPDSFGEKQKNGSSVFESDRRNVPGEENQADVWQGLERAAARFHEDLEILQREENKKSGNH